MKLVKRGALFDGSSLCQTFRSTVLSWRPLKGMHHAEEGLLNINWLSVRRGLDGMNFISMALAITAVSKELGPQLCFR